jgi:tRNA pseudouridine55 synthase
MSAPAARLNPRPRVEWREVDGILLLDKGKGMTSNAALQRARRLFRARKAGHTGSLDPLASGLLPVCFGQATKVSGMLLDADKTYSVTARLGLRTTTGDAEGEAIESAPVPVLDAPTLDAVLAGFVGTMEQVPPMYSALKQDGRRLYELARKGIEVPREARTVRILSLHRTGWDGLDLSLEVRCSKGTYVRTLVEDISAALGTVGHVIALRRTQLGPFRDERMWRLEELESLAETGGEDALGTALHAPDVAVRHWPEVQLGEAEQAYVLQGQAVFASGPGGARVRMYGPDRRFLGVGQMSPEGRRVAPVRIMLDLAAGGQTPKPLEAGDSRG